MPVVQKTEFEVYDTGTYLATVASIRQVDGQFGPQFQWDFDVEPDGQIRGWTGITMSSKSKFGQWVRGILGEIPDEVDTDKLVGLPCRLSVVIKTREDGTEFNRVDNVLAPRKGQEATKRRPAPQTVLDEEEMPF